MKYCLYCNRLNKFITNYKMLVEPFQKGDFNTMLWNKDIKWFNNFSEALNYKIEVQQYEPSFDITVMEFLN